MKKAIHIFSPGTQTSAQGVTREFTKSDLKQIAENYNKQVHEAPIRIGHEDSDKVPAWGWVENVKMKGDDLYAEVNFSPLMQEYVENGLYKKVSASFYSPESKINPEPGQWSLRHVAMLGAQPPAVKGLKGFAYAEMSETEGCFDFAAELTPDNVFDEELGPTVKIEQGPFDILKEKLEEARKEMVDAKKVQGEAQELEKEEAQAEEQEAPQPAFAEEGERKIAIKVKKKVAEKQGNEDDDDDEDEEEFQEPTFDPDNDASPKKKRGSDGLNSSDTGVKPTPKSEVFYDNAEGDTVLRDGKPYQVGGKGHDYGFPGMETETSEGAGPVVSKMPKKDSGAAMEDPKEYPYSEVVVPGDLDSNIYREGFGDAVDAYIQAMAQDGDLEFEESGAESYDEGVYAGLQYAQDFAARVDRDGKEVDLKPVSDKQPNMPVEEGELPKKMQKSGKKGMDNKAVTVGEKSDYKEHNKKETNMKEHKVKRGMPSKKEMSGKDPAETTGKGTEYSEDSKLKKDAAKDDKMAAKDRSEAKYDKKRGKTKRADSLMRDADQDDRDAGEDTVDSAEKKQGYNARLDDSMGAKNGKKKQSMKDRRDESEGMEKSKDKRKFSGDKSMDMQEDEVKHAEDTSKGSTDRKTYVDKEKPQPADGGFEQKSFGRFKVGKPSGDSGQTGRYKVGKSGMSPEDGGDNFGANSSKPATVQSPVGGDGTGRNGPAAKSSEQTIGRNKTGKTKDSTGQYDHTKMMSTGGPSGSGSAIKGKNVRVEQIKSGQTPKQVAQEYSEFAERLAELEAQNTALLAEKRAAEAQAQRLQIEEFTESLYAHGKLAPSVVDQQELTDYIVGLQTGSLEFAEGEDSSTKLMSLLANLPGMVSYSEVAAGRVDKELPFEDLDPHEKALKMSQEQGMDYAEALKKTLFTVE